MSSASFLIFCHFNLVVFFPVCEMCAFEIFFVFCVLILLFYMCMGVGCTHLQVYMLYSLLRVISTKFNVFLNMNCL
jgi:hypothetical protein